MAETNPLKQGLQSSEGKALVLMPLLLVALDIFERYVLPALTDYQSRSASPWVALGIAVITAAYIWGRSYLKGKAIETDTPPMGGAPRV